MSQEDKSIFNYIKEKLQMENSKVKVPFFCKNIYEKIMKDNNILLECLDTEFRKIQLKINEMETDLNKLMLENDNLKSIIEQINIRDESTQNGLVENVKNINEEISFFRVKAKEQDRLGENVINNNDEIKFLRNKVEEQDHLGENVSNNNEQIKFLRDKAEEQDRLGENVSNINEEIKFLRKKAQEQNDLGENIKNINEENKFLLAKAKEIDDITNSISKINTKIEYFRIKIPKLEQGLSYKKSQSDIPDSQKSEKAIDTPNYDKEYKNIDYFDFENQFRGSLDSIKQNQSIYLPYFKDCHNVLDMGCGRGEFLQLLKEHNITASGIDIYEDYVEYCRLNNLSVVSGDVLVYLKEEKSLFDGVFAGQLVEHLNLSQILELVELVYNRLSDGGYFILETPNPMSLAIFTHSFYMDPSHIKPLHPFTLKYILEKAGFQKVEILFIEDSKLDFSIPHLKGENISNLKLFNEALDVVSDALFGCQDYAIIALKKEEYDGDQC